MSYTIRYASPEDGEAMYALLPRLCAFDLPLNRKPEHTFTGDGKMLKQWMNGEHPNTFVHVAIDEDNKILAWSYVTLQPEFMSYAPSAHLEVILVSEEASGRGIGKRLLATAEKEAKERGAKSMTLHVWENNTVARSIYEKNGYDSELLRYIKWLQ